MYAMDYYAILKKKIPIFASTWMNLQDNDLSEISGTERQIFHYLHYVFNLKEWDLLN
jgi:hypothetical protein